MTAPAPAQHRAMNDERWLSVGSVCRVLYTGTYQSVIRSVVRSSAPLVVRASSWHVCRAVSFYSTSSRRTSGTSRTVSVTSDPRSPSTSGRSGRGRQNYSSSCSYRSPSWSSTSASSLLGNASLRTWRNCSMADDVRAYLLSSQSLID